MDDYFFETTEFESKENKLYILIIYDIIDNKKRNRLAKFSQGYGFRIQKSAFEAFLTKSLYQKLLREIKGYASPEDSIRIYKIIGKGQVTVMGIKESVQPEEVVII